jgi:hypothetical protein
MCVARRLARRRAAAKVFGSRNVWLFNQKAVQVWSKACYTGFGGWQNNEPNAQEAQANYRAWVLSELGTQTIPYAMSDQS